ncbi:cellulose-binding domain-containing protein, partial [Glycomyces sp. L485]|uniref:cellulose binding domain-containing protein n=1 Tax=Glycomyces sp. L485 TaxID=2909235 RepID=UPI001F4A55F0
MHEPAEAARSPLRKKRRTIAIAAGAAAVLGVGAVTAVVANNASADPGCEVDYRVVSDWGSGFHADVSVTAGEPIDGWTIEWDFTSAVSGTSAWNVTDQSLDGRHFTASNGGWNGVVNAGETTRLFGFIGQGPTADITDVTVNGESCAPGGAPIEEPAEEPSEESTAESTTESPTEEPTEDESSPAPKAEDGGCDRPVGASPEVEVTEVELGAGVIGYGQEGDTDRLPMAIAARPSGGSWLTWMGT